MSAWSGALVNTLTTLGLRRMRLSNHAGAPLITALGSLMNLSTCPARAHRSSARPADPGRAVSSTYSWVGPNVLTHDVASGTPASSAIFCMGSGSSRHSQGGLSGRYGSDLGPPAQPVGFKNPVTGA
jgi:hypothetical protein